MFVSSRWVQGDGEKFIRNGSTPKLKVYERMNVCKMYVMNVCNECMYWMYVMNVWMYFLKKLRIGDLKDVSPNFSMGCD